MLYANLQRRLMCAFLLLLVAYCSPLLTPILPYVPSRLSTPRDSLRSSTAIYDKSCTTPTCAGLNVLVLIMNPVF